MSKIVQDAKHAIFSTYKGIVENITPTLSTSKYLEEGVLTPDEFVEAGNLLTFKCPTWSWESGIAAKAVNYLPKDKQFLLTRNVPCMMRVRSLEEDSKSQQSLSIKDDDGGDDWVAPASSTSSNVDPLDITPTTEGVAKMQLGSTALSAGATSSTTTSTTTTTATNDDDDGNVGEIPDIETFEGDNLVEDDSATLQVPQPSSTEEDNILKTRTYDLSITYDKYHQTPKVWLFGYDENKQPLKPEEIFQDISEDHAHKTVTIEQHPFLGIPCAFIHPCRHAEVMKKLIQRQVEAGKTPRVDQYLFLFLKFIAAVIPTVEYDYTLEMDT